jgi:hypothetical protein
MLNINDLVSEWDPLADSENNDQAVVEASKKRQIRNILKSYVGSFDPFSELLQNAMDAVEKRVASVSEPFSPNIQVIINLTENSLQVIDNGVGFSKEQFRSFLAPNVSFKDSKESRGNKGVGATYIAYGFNRLEIRTKSENFQFEGQLVDGRKWVDDQSGTVFRPKVGPTKLKDEHFEKMDRGTSFKLVFGGTNTRPSNLSWYGATTPEQWEYLLLVKTPLGHINLPDTTESKIAFSISVEGANVQEAKTANGNAKYKFPHEEISASRRLKVIQDAQRAAVDANKDISKAIEKFKKSNGIFEVYDTKDLLKIKTLDSNEIELIERYSITAYGYFAYSTSIWDALNDTKANLRKNYRVIRGGLQLANNHMPQGELISIPLQKNTHYQNQTHVIVHFDGADPDLGRKGFQPELKALSEKLSGNLVQLLSAHRGMLKADSGSKPQIEKEIKLHDWIKNLEEHETNNPLILINENFFLPTKKISINSVPLSEQDVIVLFNQLLAGGVIRGIRLMSTSQITQYDGLFRFAAEDPLSDLEFEKNKNPLGVYIEQLSNKYVGPPSILEYKFSLDGLIREFENGEKQESDVKLAVFWDFGTEYQRDYTVTSLLDFENIQHREHHGITHLVNSSTTSFAVICLKELIDVLNDPIGAQIFQQQQYSDNI